MAINDRITEITGAKYPIVPPMGWIARSALASVVSNAGGLGIIEMFSGELDNIKREVRLMRELTDRPFGMNVALSYVRGLCAGRGGRANGYAHGVLLGFASTQ